MEKIPKFDKRRAFNKAVGPGKNLKSINVGPTFIPDYKVVHLVSQCSHFEVLGLKRGIQLRRLGYPVCTLILW